MNNRYVGPNEPALNRTGRNDEQGKKTLTLMRSVGEVTYVCEPLLHLMARAKFGVKSWKPFLVSLSCDLFSQVCHGDKKAAVSRTEKAELYRRRTLMFIYLLRSPFYDKYTKKILLTFLIFAKDNIPIGGKVAEILLAYIPHYRKIYSYLWAK